MIHSDTLYAVPRLLSHEPEPFLVSLCGEMNRGQPALDLQAGSGANVYFLANRGFRVDALVGDDETDRALRSLAANTTLPVNVVGADFSDFRPQIGVYSAVIAMDIIPELSRQEILLLHQKLLGWTMAGSLLFVSALSTTDPSFAHFSKAWRKVGRNSFTDGRGKFRSFLEPSEVLEIFAECLALQHWEGLGPEETLPSGELYRPGLIKAAFRR